MSFRQFSTIVEKYNYLIVKNKWKSHNFQYWKRDRKKHRKTGKNRTVYFSTIAWIHRKSESPYWIDPTLEIHFRQYLLFLQIQFFMIFLFEFPDQFLAFFLLKRLNDLLVIFFCLFLTFKIIYLTIPSVCGKY